MLYNTSPKAWLLYFIGLISLLHFYFLSIYHTNDQSPVSLRGKIKNSQSIAPEQNITISDDNLIKDFDDFILYGSVIKGNAFAITSVIAIVGFNNTKAPIEATSFVCVLGSNEIIADFFVLESNFRVLDQLNVNNSSTLFELTCNLQIITISKIPLYLYKSTFLNIQVIFEAVKRLSFSIPLYKRRAGYLLDTTRKMSNFDPWNKILPHQAPVKSPRNLKKIYLCVPGVDILPIRLNLPIYLEFLQHHFLLGIQHIFLGVNFQNDSPEMQNLLLILRDYISKGLLTINSQTSPYSQTSNSLLMERETINKIYLQLCLQLSFGMTDYFGVWDIRDFFIPKLPYNNIFEILKYLELQPTLFQTHYYNSTTIKTINNNKNNNTQYLPYLPYIILPTQAVGASRWGLLELWLGDSHNAPGIPIEWGKEPRNSSKPFIIRLSQLKNCIKINNSINHYTQNNNYNNITPLPCNEQPLTSNIPPINPLQLQSKDPLQYLILLYRHINTPCPRLHRFLGNEYTHRFYKKVRKSLHQKNIDLFVTLPEKTGKGLPNATNWKQYNDIYYSILPINQSLSLLISTNKSLPKYITSTIATSNTTNILQILNIVNNNNNNNIINNININDTSNNATKIVQLPAFAEDHSELFIGALLERNFDTFILQLAIFLLCPASLDPAHAGLGAISIRDDAVNDWMKVIQKSVKVKYAPGGQRDVFPRFFCRISNRQHEQEYVVEGYFIPNRVTPDTGANSRTDILRCPLKGMYRYLARSSEMLKVEVLRENQILIVFEVPWSTRKTGYMLDIPEDASRFDVWKGYPPVIPQAISNPTPVHLNVTTPYFKSIYVPTNQIDDIYMCVPGIETGPGKNLLPAFLEFVQHHLLIGVNHIFLGAIFTWTSPHMTRLLQIFRSFIEEGSVSFASQTGDNIDHVNSIEGIFWNRNIPKITYINMCLYLAKGMADYVAVWDTDEYFIPKFPYNTIMDVLRVVDVPPSHRLVRNFNSKTNNLTIMENNWISGRGLADKDGHPLCYLSLSALVVLKDVNNSDTWLGQRFSHAPEAFESAMTNMKGFRKTIIPTRKIFYAGLHFAGACKLDSEWNGCDTTTGKINAAEFCYEKTGKARKKSFIPRRSLFYDDHRIDEVVWEKDYKHVNIETEALIYHYYTIHRDAVTDPIFHASEEAKSRPNEYSSRFFHNVMKQLERRDLTKLMS